MIRHTKELCVWNALWNFDGYCVTILTHTVESPYNGPASNRSFFSPLKSVFLFSILAITEIRQ